MCSQGGHGPILKFPSHGAGHAQLSPFHKLFVTEGPSCTYVTVTQLCYLAFGFYFFPGRYLKINRFCYLIANEVFSIRFLFGNRNTWQQNKKGWPSSAHHLLLCLGGSICPGPPPSGRSGELVPPTRLQAPGWPGGTLLLFMAQPGSQQTPVERASWFRQS